MYSGSRSCATVAPGPKTRTPAGSAMPPKPAVVTAPVATSMMLTEPSGSTLSTAP